MSFGPIQAFIIGFPESGRLDGRIADELLRLSDSGQIRIVDAVLALHEGDETALLSVSDLDEIDRAELRASIAALIGLGIAGREGAVAGALLGASVQPGAPTTAELVAADLLEELPAGSGALVLAIEHRWARPLRDAVRDAGGVVLGHRLITAEDLIAAGVELGDEEDD